ncbi:MAG: complex I NDUFA9 subunit family protein [Alphaproteobacteria bacterium]|nr:complex I NDUFA9 subunit family protein [Alphaproteobacteria bacterium]
MTAIPSTKLAVVYGGSGFLGRHIVRALANDGWRIRVAVRHPNTAHFLKPMGRVGSIQIVKTNINNDASVEAAMHGADAVINLVGILVPGGSQRFDAIHIEGARRIARLAAAQGVARLVHISALGAAKDSTARYFRTKAEGEAAVRDAYASATVFRPSLVFGPEDDFFNRFGWLARMSPVLPLIGGGKTRFQPVYVGDVAQAIVQVLAKPETAGKVFELAGPQVYTFKEIMQLVLRETRRKRILLPLPFRIARIQAMFLGLLPKPLLTLDQVRMLATDNVPSDGSLGLRDLGIAPTAAETIIPSYLWRFRKHGEFEAAVS